MLDEIQDKSITLERTQRRIRSLKETLNGKGGCVHKIGIYYFGDTKRAGDDHPDLTIHPSVEVSKKLVSLLLSDLETREVAQKAILKKLCGDYAKK